MKPAAVRSRTPSRSATWPVVLSLAATLLWGVVVGRHVFAQDAATTDDPAKEAILKDAAADASSPKAEAPKDEKETEEAAKQEYRNPVLIPIRGELTPLTERSFHRRLVKAEEVGADLIVIEIDSPGGFVDSSLKIADALLHVDWARTVAYVPREAMSGGAIVALGCDEILIGPHAQFGDAGMIQLSLEEGGFRYAPEKARSALVAHVRTLATAKGRPPALAEALVDMELVVYRVRNKLTGSETFMSDAEINSAPDPENWEKIRPVFETRQKHFMTLNGPQAVELQMAQAVVRNRDELAQRYRLNTEFRVLEHTRVDTTVLVLNHPLVTGLIFVVGLIALYFEFNFPGTFIGGMIAALCFAIFFWSRFLGGTSGWLEVILFVAGISFLVMEIFVLPGFGVAGISGLLLVMASMVMASQAFVVPQNSEQLNTTLTQFGVVGGSGVLFLVAAAVLSRHLGSIPIFKSLMLEVPTDSGAAVAQTSASLKPVPPLVPVVLGDEGIADSPLRPAGKARFGDHYVDVVTDGVFIDRGRPVRVSEVSGHRVVVREVTTDH